MHRLTTAALAALALLTACAPKPVGEGSFRRTGTQIWSNAVTAPAALAGTWRQVATFADGQSAGCAPGFASFAPTAGGLDVAARLCVNGRDVAVKGPMVVSGPGRLMPAGQAQAPLDREWWLLWIDVDVRTIVIGTPSGAFGVILNRDARLPADRAKAARDILEWNGYDTARLRGF